MNNNGILYTILALNIVVLCLNIFFVFRLKLIKYLLEQPVVKKVSSNTKLKPHSVNRGKSSDRSSSRGGRPPRSRDGKTDRGGRGDKGRGTGRPIRNRGGRSDPQTRNAALPGNSAAETEKKTPETGSVKPEQKPAGAPVTQSKQPETVKKSESPAPAPRPEPKPEAANKPKAAPQTEAIQHGRRPKVAKAPSFED